MILTKAFLCLPFFSSYQLNGLCGSLVGIKEGILASQNIAKSKPDLKKMQVKYFD
jgi:hypothetical protein